MTLYNSSSYHLSCAALVYLLNIQRLQTTSEALTAKTPVYMPPKSQYANSFQVRLNEFFKGPVPDPLKTAFSIFREDASEDKLDVEDTVTLLTAAPGAPGVPRPLWLVMLGSLPTGLLWYGYYKFVVEEELLQMELDTGREPRGFGGYGTLGPFTYGILLGPLASMLHIPGGINWSSLGVIFIYYTQFLLYDRVNKLYEEDADYRLANITEDIDDSNDVLPLPLQVWWCLPIFFPFNFIVGLRQVHFLSQYLYRQRGSVSSSPPDPVAEFFPFIKKASLTWQELITTPSLWCSVFSDADSFDLSVLPDPIRELFANSNKQA
mmetsp:Transcript_3074/g.6524  ORF Transcript_3074/g.6524 Transcript_3074/m.6524 type:complete len:321 (+) Transcript_3074:79-1041(+)